MAAPYQRPLSTTPRTTRSIGPGFAVLTFDNGRLLWPEVAHVVDEEKGLVTFRGRI